MTCDLNQVSESSASSAALCCAKGRIQANFILFEYEQSFFLLLPVEMVALLIKALNKYALFSQVVIEDVSKDWLIRTTVKSKNSELFHVETDTVIVITHPAGSILLGQAADKLTDYCDRNKLSIAVERDWQMANIMTGFATILPQTSGLFTPHMINLQKFNGVSFSKGCYIGQEIIARTQHLGTLKRHLHHISFCAETEVEAGAAIETQEGNKVGVLINNVYDLSQAQGLAVVEDRFVGQQKLFVQGKEIIFHLTLAE